MPRATGRPAFPGAKTALLPLLWAALATVVPANHWPQLTFIDAFLGSGAVTAEAKARFATVYANDIAPRSTMIGRALFQNVSQALAPANVLALARPPADAPPAPTLPITLLPPLAACAAGFWQHFHSSALQGLRRDLIGVWILTWIERAYPMSLASASDARWVATGAFDRVSPRRLPHYLGQARRLLAPTTWLAIAADLNGQIRPGRARVFEQDVFDFLPAVDGDVVYLDPPYAGTQDYGQVFAAIDAFFGWPPQAPSPFARRQPPLDALLDASRHLPTLLLSLDNTVLDAAALEATVRRHRAAVTLIPIPYRRYAALATPATNRRRREFLVVAQ